MRALQTRATTARDGTTADDSTIDEATPGEGDVYLKIRPNEAELDPTSVTTQFRRLHDVGTPANGGGWLSRLLRRTPTRHTIEFLLVGDGTPEGGVTCYVGIDDSELVDSLEHAVRALFPHGFSVERVRVDEEWPRSLGGEPGDDGQCYGVEFLGKARRRQDWQTGLTTFADLTGGDHGYVPLASVVEAASKADRPVVYQALLRPKPKWYRAADARIGDLQYHLDTPRQQLVSHVFGYPDEDFEPPLDDRNRVELIEDRLHTCSFEVNARAVVLPPPSDREPSSPGSGDEATGTPSPASNASSIASSPTASVSADESDPEAGDEGSTASVDASMRVLGPSSTSTSATGPASSEPSSPSGNASESSTAGPSSTEPSSSSSSPTGPTPTSPTTVGGARVAGDIAKAFGGVEGPYYEVVSRIREGRRARSVLSDVLDRTFYPPNYERLATWIPLRANRSRGIVADAREAPSFVLVGGDSLSPAGARGVDPTPDERTSIRRPPEATLSTYRTGGLALGTPLDADGRTGDRPVAVPPHLQQLHVAWFGESGAGKSTSLVHGLLRNHAATDGADVLLDGKGDGMALDYLRAHYAEHGDLDDVLYFDCSQLLPALSFFDVRDQLAAGVDRTTAVEDVVDHYVELLRLVMGDERYERAIRAPDVVRYLVKALFDLNHGEDAFYHSNLVTEARRMRQREAPPAVSDPALEEMLEGVVAADSRTFDRVMSGVLNRIEKIPVDRRLGCIFNHVPDEDDPHFDLAEYLDEDVVIVLDAGGLRSDAKHALGMVLLSNLWTALRRRTHRQPEADHPLVNLYVEEAADVAASDLLQELLAQSRSFGCSLTLSMQFPGQLDEDCYDEVLNEVSTVVTGPVPDDRRLARRLATADMDPADVGTRLRALSRGEWLVRLPADFGDQPPRPFLLESLPLPPGAPDGPEPLSDVEREGFDAALDALREQTEETAGITVEQPDASSSGETDELVDAGRGWDTPLPYTDRLPKPVDYDRGLHALQCAHCGRRHDPTLDGMRRAIECCSSLEHVSRESIPVCDLHLKLSIEECRRSTRSIRQLLFVQAVYDAQQRRLDPLEYDLLRDSMTLLRDYVGVDAEDVEELVDAGVLTHDTEYPHRLYSVTPQGRDAVGERYRRGQEFGHGVGDMNESSEHVLAVELARRYLETEYRDDPEWDVTEVVPYYDLADRERLDVAGLDTDGEIVVAVEAERLNGREATAAPEDYDKLAACEPEEAIWVVTSESAAHRLLSALNDPSDGVPRVEKTYSETTRTQNYSIDTPGMTDVLTTERLLTALGIE